MDFKNTQKSNIIRNSNERWINQVGFNAYVSSFTGSPHITLFLFFIKSSVK